MTLSKVEISALVKGAVDGGEPSVRPPWAVEMRRMLRALPALEFRPERATPLVKLSEAGARYGWRDLEATSNPNLLASVSPKAKANLTRDLRHALERLTRPCLELERTSFGLALNSIGGLARSSDSKLAERMFLGDKPSDRLFSLFKKFPVLARLWCQLISQWREHVTEVLLRFTTDRTALSDAFFGGQPIRTIGDFRCGLSDSHNHGRTVMQLQCGTGAVIYKPRPGDGEWEWGSLLEWMNTQSFQPRLRAGRVLRRKGYCWMERIEVAPCKKGAAARRFYQRIGGMIAAAYLLKTVDCHRDNLIASGEDPVLVDADALWHVSPATKAQTPLDLLYRTGFLPNSNPRSLQSRSSVLGLTNTGKHVARIGTKPLSAVQYEREILSGFSHAWHCILGTKDRRRAFARRLRRIQSRERRWIYRPTEKYAAIKRASIQPAALRSGSERNLLIARLCQRSSMTAALIRAEIDALERLDIPYFARRIKEQYALDTADVPADVREALRHVLA
jgi:lantibiotic modifying enzyme